MCAAAMDVTGVVPEVPTSEMFKGNFVQTVISLWEEDPLALCIPNDWLKQPA